MTSPDRHLQRFTPTRAGLDPVRAKELRRRRSLQRGFTLVELLVATTTGLLVAAAAYVLSRDAMQLFQHEARIATAQMGTVLGMSRITADLQRAGFMATPNVADDPDVCATSLAPFTTADFELQALRFYYQTGDGSHPQAPRAAAPQSLDNAIDPDAVDIVGNFSTTEQFPVAAINDAGGSIVIDLQPNTGAVYRTVEQAVAGGGSFGDIFQQGRLLRLLDEEGKESYGEIQSVSTTPAEPIPAGTLPTSITITLAAAPTLPNKAAMGSCGYTGFGTGMLVNPVSRIRYELRPLNISAPSGAVQADYDNYAPLVAVPPGTQGTVTGDDERVELIRVELDRNNDDVPGTLELITEYATELKFGITVACDENGALPTCDAVGVPPAVPSANYPIMKQVDLDSAFIEAIDPQRIRGVRVRLGARARAPDRNEPLAGGSRFLLDNAPDGLNYARTRIMHADVAIPNLSATQW